MEAASKSSPPTGESIDPSSRILFFIWMQTAQLSSGLYIGLDPVLVSDIGLIVSILFYVTHVYHQVPL